MILKIGNDVVMLDMTLEELNNRVSKASSVFKTMTGIGNNSAWAACLEALDHIRLHPRYKHRVKQAYKTRNTANSSKRISSMALTNCKTNGHQCEMSAKQSATLPRLSMKSSELKASRRKH